METGFQFEFLWADQDVLKLRIHASNGRFSATSDLYVGIGGLAKAASKLMGFPGNLSDQRELKLGEFGPKTAGGAVNMRFYCEGRAGRAFVETTMESDYDGARAENAHFFAGVEPSAVDVFVSELQRVESQKCGAARLSVLVPA